MKKLPSPEQTFTSLLSYMIKAYNASPQETDGTIQFHIHHKGENLNYYLQIKRDKMTLKEGITSNPTASLTASLFDWLDLADGRLNPVIGVITKKLAFTGDKTFFSKVLKEHDTVFDLNEYRDPVTSFETNPVKHWRKPENILVINGSPRKKQGYTQFYLNPFIEGMKSTGANVELVSLKDFDIKPCTGCWICWISGTGKCVIKDDMEQLQSKFEACEMLVAAFPLYVDGMPASMKILLERLTVGNYPYMIPGVYKTRHPRRDKKDRSLVLFSVCGFPEIEHFKAVREHIKAWAHNSHMPVVAEVLRPECMNLYNNPLLYKTLLQTHDALRDGGEQVVKGGKISSKTIDVISQSSGSISDFHKGSNGFWFDLIQRGRGPY